MLVAGAAPVRAWNTEKVRRSKSEEKVFKERGKGVQRVRKRCSKSEEKVFKDRGKGFQITGGVQTTVRGWIQGSQRWESSRLPPINITPPNKLLQPR